MNFLKRRFAKAPEGTAALFFIQIFSTLGFAVLYSTLVLYATKHLQLGVKEATTLMGVFGAFNYGLHLFGGYLGGRFLSNSNLFVGGMALQVFGCACIATGTLALFYVGLALFLTGSGLNVTCINMMLTQRFTPEDPRREGAFLWNYAGMNVGFFVGFSAAGYFQGTESYASLFIFATLGNRSEEHTSELQSPDTISYAVFCLKKKNIAQDEATNLLELAEDLRRRVRAAEAFVLLHKFLDFFFNDTGATEIYTVSDTLSLHDALPIATGPAGARDRRHRALAARRPRLHLRQSL